MSTSSASPKLQAEYFSKLADLLEEHDELAAKKSEITQALAGELKIVAKQIARVRRILKGTENPQEEFPGTEVGERRRDPIIARVLRAAAGLAERDKEEQREPKAKKSASKASASLAWHKEGSNHVAPVPGGVYCVEPDADGFRVWWTPEGGRSKRIGGDTDPERAQAIAERHNVERAGNALLKNAGAGELVQASLAGPAAAFKKGRRRG